MNTLTRSQPYADWRLLRVYINYRVFLAILLLALFTVPAGKGLVGAANGLLFLLTSVLYLIIAIWGLILTRHAEQDLTLSALLRLIIDLIALTLMMHASGSLSSQFAVLFMVTVAAGNILLSGRLGAAVAAVAAFAIIYEQFYIVVSDNQGLSPATLAQASLLGVGFFAVALFSQMISHRVRQSEALAASRAEDILGLQALNAQIIQRMRTGIIVVDDARRVLLINDAARVLLGTERQVRWSEPLGALSPTLDAGVLAWRQNPLMRPIPFRNTETSTPVSASFAAMGDDSRSRDVLVFLEDTAQMAQQAQQLKLASLGRLTASIAHEVRNPLGAISHATQLLAESPAITSGPDQRLLDIIQQHCLRMNSIVENILQLSRRQSATPETFGLEDWLRGFAEEYNSGRPDPALISIYSSLADMKICFDPRQLYQIVANLVTNGLRYSLKHMGREEVRLVTGVLPLEDVPYLDIIDSGPGIPEANRVHLFEPFFTTEGGGTGLGLYLARELCEANQARLDCMDDVRGGACFRITFAHPDRMNHQPIALADNRIAIS